MLSASSERCLDSFRDNFEEKPIAWQIIFSSFWKYTKNHICIVFYPPRLWSHKVFISASWKELSQNSLNVFNSWDRNNTNDDKNGDFFVLNFSPKFLSYFLIQPKSLCVLECLRRHTRREWNDKKLPHEFFFRFYYVFFFLPISR